MTVQVMELVVKCSVPRDEAEDIVIRLRNGEHLVEVPSGFHCMDAFESYEQTDDPETAVIRAGFGR